MVYLNALVNGILFGGVLAVLAYGVNLVFGVLEVIHFFYGQLIMVGLYIIYVLTMWFHLPLVISCLVAIAVVTFLNVLAQSVVVQPLLTRKTPMLNQFLAMGSVVIILENLFLVIFGADYKTTTVSLPVLHVGELYIMTSNLIAFLGGIITLAFLYVFLHKTYMGLAIRAVAQDADAARIMGINPRLIYIFTMALGGILASVAASLFVPIYAVYPYFGTSFTILAFVTVVLGGMGNLFGGFISAFIIGLVTIMGSTLINPEFGAISAYLIFIIVILFRPEGLLGLRARI